jgi:hypothetical protein
LSTLFTGDTDTNIGFLNHGHIVCAITDGERHDIQCSLDQRDDSGFLCGTDTTAQH